MTHSFGARPCLKVQRRKMGEVAISQGGNSNSFSAEKKKHIAGPRFRQSRQRQGVWVGKAFGVVVGFPVLFSSVLHPSLTSVERER